MSNHKDLPLLLLDNSSMMSVLNEGTFKCHNISLEEATKLLEVFDEENTIRCFDSMEMDTIIFGYLGAGKRSYEYKKIRNMRPGQDALVFKLYTTASATQPVIQADDGVEAKKIQNVYVYCQLISRID